MNVMMLLEMASAAFPERLAFTDGSTGVSFTYQQLFDAARSRAGTIQASGASRLVKLDVSNLGTPLSLHMTAPNRRKAWSPHSLAIKPGKRLRGKRDRLQVEALSKLILDFLAGPDLRFLCVWWSFCFATRTLRKQEEGGRDACKLDSANSRGRGKK